MRSNVNWKFSSKNTSVGATRNLPSKFGGNNWRSLPLMRLPPPLPWLLLPLLRLLLQCGRRRVLQFLPDTSCP
jgi:hypothetical protein